MKSFVCSVLLTSVAGHVAVGFHNSANIERQANRILADQLYDYEQQIMGLRSRRSYEDGVRDGVTNSRNIQYMEGYHAALQNENQFSNIVTYSGE